MEAWLKKANTAIEDDARFAYDMCRNTALKEQVELDFVLEQFLKAFKKIVEKGEDHG